MLLALDRAPHPQTCSPKHTDVYQRLLYRNPCIVQNLPCAILSGVLKTSHQTYAAPFAGWPILGVEIAPARRVRSNMRTYRRGVLGCWALGPAARGKRWGMGLLWKGVAMERNGRPADGGAATNATMVRMVSVDARRRSRVTQRPQVSDPSSRWEAPNAEIGEFVDQNR